MIIIKIFKDNILTNEARFTNQAEADLWLEKELENSSFGDRNTFEIKVEYT